MNGFKVSLHYKELSTPLKWKKPRTIFVDSMSDLFHADIPIHFIQSTFRSMAQAHWHTYQILTKRSVNLKNYDAAGALPWLPNIWMGVSVEDNRVLNRIDDLRFTGAFTKFLSCEPLIGSLGKLDLTNINWVIVGGESGAGARECKQEWIEEIVDQCKLQGVPVFVKQLGSVLAKKLGCSNKSGKDINEFPEHLRIREYPVKQK